MSILPLKKVTLCGLLAQKREVLEGLQRLPLETNYFEAFNRANVELIDLSETPIDRFTPTGIQTTNRLMLELTRNGYNDEAYRLLNLRTFPSWGFMIENGATTIWERWDGYVRGRGFQNPVFQGFGVAHREKRDRFDEALEELSGLRRTPAVLAMGAATLAELSQGRFVLGLGTSSHAMIEGWHGVDYGKPLKRTREAVAILTPEEPIHLLVQLYQLRRKPLQLTGREFGHAVGLAAEPVSEFPGRQHRRVRKNEPQMNEHRFVGIRASGRLATSCTSKASRRTNASDSLISGSSSTSTRLLLADFLLISIII